MLAEHLVYSAALAILAGMLFLRFTGRDSSWIIILVAFAPDLDEFIGGPLNRLGYALLFPGQPIHHGSFYNLAATVIFALIVAILLCPFRIRFFDSFLFAFIGFGAHLLEDALVYRSSYMFLWPISPVKIQIGWLSEAGRYNANFFHIANAEVLFIGLVLFLIAILIRTRVEGSVWIRWYMPEKVYRRFFTHEKTM
jgi:hypothetical protein